MIGEKIGHYEIRELLGRGAMGVVYRAYDEALHRDMAIKFLSTDAASTAVDVERFYQEARAAAALSHPNVVVIHDIGEHKGRCFFAMELLPGASLRKVIREGPRPGWREGLEIGIQVCRALEAAHERGMLHRDIKPDNVWLLPDGLVKILDFGIVRFSTAQTLTQAGETPGTPEYMAPEQIMGEALDGRADLYSLGILLYELFTGQLPFSGPNAITVIYKQMEEDPRPPSQLAPDLPLPVETVLLKAMAKDPDRRYGSATKMREAMEALLAGREVAEEEEPQAVPDAAPDADPPGLKDQGVRFECRLVGREEEFGQLKAAVARLQEGQGETILIGGEAGIGKTRTAQEAMAYARRRGALVLQGTCLFVEGPEPYLPFIEALGQSLESENEDERQKILAFIRDEVPELEEMIQQLMTVIRTRRTLGTFDPEASVATSKERLFEAITQLLLFLSRETPVVLLLDDLHWADSGTLQLLYYIARNAQDRRLLILGTYRTEDLLPDGGDGPGLFVETTQRMSREGICRTIELQGLKSEAINTMLRFIFRRVMFSGEFRASLFRETCGNPFFVIEVLKLLQDEGAIFQRRGVWRERRAITGTDIPKRVYDVVVRRLERLSDEQRELLHTAAVIGDRFTSDALVQIAEARRVQVLRDLDRIERVHHLVRSDGEAYAFGNAKVREILYNEISAELRREYHLACGLYLEKQVLEEGRDRAAEVGRHLYFGGDFARGLPYLVRAGDRAARVFAYQEARDFYRWALEALSGAGEVDGRKTLEPSLLYKLACAWDQLGERRNALDELVRAEALIGEDGDGRMAAEVEQRIGQLYFRSGEYEKAAEEYQKSIRNFRKAGDHKAVCAVLVRAANIPFQQGNWTLVRSYYSRALRIAQQVEDRRQIATIHMNSGIMSCIQGKMDEALGLYEKSRLGFKEVEDLSGLSQVYLNLGWSYSERRAWGKAREAYTEALSLARRTRNIFVEAKCYLNLAEVLMEMKDLKGCKNACLRALEIFWKVNKRIEIADVFKTLGQVATVEGKWGEAGAYFEKSIAANRDVGHTLGEGKAYLEYARMFKAQDNLDRAVKELDHALALFEKIQARENLKGAGDLKKEIESLQYLAEA